MGLNQALVLRINYLIGNKKYTDEVSGKPGLKKSELIGMFQMAHQGDNAIITKIHCHIESF